MLDKLWKTEDYWAVWLGLGIIILALVAFWSGRSISGWAVTPGGWSDLSTLASDLASQFGGYLTIFILFGVVFTASMAIMGHKVSEFLPC